MALFVKVVAFEYTVVKWSGKHLTPAGIEERSRPRRHEAEEARLPPRGKQVFGAQWNEHVRT